MAYTPGGAGGQLGVIAVCEARLYGGGGGRQGGARVAPLSTLFTVSADAPDMTTQQLQLVPLP